MILRKRAEGYLVKDERPLRKLMPYLMPTRNESVVYFEQMIDVGPALDYLKANTGLTLFHLFMTSWIKSLVKWPKMNRFISGGNIYQRYKPTLSFVVKKRLDEHAGMTAVKIEFEPEDTVFQVADRMNQKIKEGRSDNLTTSEKEMAVITRLPGFLIRLIFRAQRLLDSLNLLPRKLIQEDPMYASMFIANFASIGLRAGWHHLSEYGTTPLFGVIGKVETVPFVTRSGEVEVKQQAVIRWSFDERIIDGLYCHRAMHYAEKLLLNPERLEHPDV